MSEWFKEHAWKSTLLARTDAHELPPTHSRSTTSRNIDTRRYVLVNHHVDRGLIRYLTQFRHKSDFDFAAPIEKARVARYRGAETMACRTVSSAVTRFAPRPGPQFARRRRASRMCRRACRSERLSGH